MTESFNAIFLGNVHCSITIKLVAKLLNTMLLIKNPNIAQITNNWKITYIYPHEIQKISNTERYTEYKFVIKKSKGKWKERWTDSIRHHGGLPIKEFNAKGGIAIIKWR